MDLKDYLRILRKFWRSIAALTVSGLLLGLVGAFLTPPTYVGRSAVFVAVRDGDTARERGASYAAGQARSYAQAAMSPLVLKPVIAKLNLAHTPESLINDDFVSASVEANTSIINLTAADSDPVLAARIAQALADELVVAIDGLSPTDSDGGRTLIGKVIRPAEVPTRPGAPGWVHYVTVGLLIGVAAGLIQAFVRAVFGRAPQRVATPS